MKINTLIHLILFVLLLSLKGVPVVAQQFTELITGALVNTPSDSRSVNLVDVNNDGLDDVFISNGPSDGAANFLYLNNGDLTFEQVMDNAIVSDTSAFDGASFADTDNDGDLDAYIVSWYGLQNYYYRNMGSGVFEYEPQNVSGSMGTYSETAAWGDLNNDGYVDLYSTNSGGILNNLLYLNDTEGSFLAVLDGPAVTDAYYSRGVNWVDYDNDGDQDLYVCNESNQKNNLYRNDGNGVLTRMEDIAPVTGQQGSMSSSWGDVDNDGDLDLFVANSLYFGKQNNQLFINNGDGTFNEVSDMPVVNDASCSYSSSFVDYDNDGDLDLFVSNGYCSGDIDNFLYKNDGTGYFQRDLEALPDFTTPCSFGAAWSDLDLNGFMDLVVSTCKNSSSSELPVNMVFMNNGNENHWLKLKLEGNTSNRSALGARVYVSCMIDGIATTQMREINSQDGYCSQGSLLTHFGLGNAPGQVDIQVVFPSGSMSNLTVDPDTVIYVQESPSTGWTEINKEPSISFSAYVSKGSSMINFSIQNPDRALIDRIIILDISGRNRGELSLNSYDSEVSYIHNMSLDHGIYIATLISEQHIETIKFYVH